MVLRELSVGRRLTKMKSNKLTGLFCLAALLATFLALPPTVSASPGLALVKYKPSSHAIGSMTVTSPASAYDWNNATYASFSPGSVTSGYFNVKSFVLASGYTAPPEERGIAFVDICLRQYGGGGGKGWYRILYQISGSAIILVDWTQTTYGSDTTLVWYNQIDPSSPAWTWDSLPKVEFYVETKAVGGGGTPTFREIEVWLNVYYYNQPTMSVQTPSGKHRTPFSVNITIANADSLYGWEFELRYNNTYLTATSVVNSTFFPVGKHPRFWSLEVNDTAGRVRAACSLIGDYAGQDGSGVLAVVYFNVKAPFPPEPQLLDLRTTKLLGYDYSNKRIFSMLHTAVDGTVLLSIRDVLVVSVDPEAMLAYQGLPRDINVTVSNSGDITETFNVTLYYGSYEIGAQQKVAALAPGNSKVLTWTWDTTGIPYGNYTISARADHVPFETYTGNNIGSDGEVKMTIQGDVNGDQTVNVFDILAVKSRWGRTPASPDWIPEYDSNVDDSINVFDILTIKAHWGQSW
jgi:hypothetical protein